MAKAQSARVALIHWNAQEGKHLAEIVRKAGLEVSLHSADRPAIMRSFRAKPPAAIVISLDRLPSQGRDAAIVLRSSKATRMVPIIFAGGEREKVEGIRRTLPDAAYATWHNVAQLLKRVVAAAPPENPLVPNSILAAYSVTPLAKKLAIQPNSSVALLNEPEGFVELLGDLPQGVEFTQRIVPRTRVAICFVRAGVELATYIDSVAASVRSAASCRLWIAWPKKTSPLACDVSEKVVRMAALAVGFVDYKVAAIDADWSSLLFVPKRDGRLPRRTLMSARRHSRSARPPRSNLAGRRITLRGLSVCRRACKAEKSRTANKGVTRYFLASGSWD